MRAGPGPTVRRRQLGNILRQYRTEAGKSVQQVAHELLCSPAKISRIETGQRSPTLRDVRDLANIYRVTEESRERLMAMAQESRDRGWWQSLNLPPALETLIGMEQAATQIREFEIVVLPGLLQTREYADALVGMWLPDDPTRRQAAVDVRMRRQRILKNEHPPELSVVLDEAALRREVGGRTVMRDQLTHLARLIDATIVHLRILPFSAGAHVGMLNGFTLLEFDQEASAADEPAIPAVVYVEYQDNTEYFDQPEEVGQYIRDFALLQGQCLSRDDSAILLASLLADH